MIALTETDAAARHRVSGGERVGQDMVISFEDSEDVLILDPRQYAQLRGSSDGRLVGRLLEWWLDDIYGMVAVLAD